MAYPGEPEQVEYQQYVIEAQSNGENPLPIEAWRELRKAQMQQQQTMGQAIDSGLGYEQVAKQQ